MTRGEVLTRVSTLARGLLRGYPGTTAVPLRITDAATVDLLRVGDRISLVVADPDGRRTPTRLVDDVPVVAIPRSPDSGVGTGTPGSTRGCGDPVDTSQRGRRRGRHLDTHPGVESIGSAGLARATRGVRVSEKEMSP